jgi:hypothetical protein
MAYRINQVSYHLGVIFAFSEMVAIDVKKMAFSYPFLPKEYDRLIKNAKRITKEQGVKIRLEKGILTTDLFPEEFTKGKWVFIIYKYPEVLQNCLHLKSKKEQLIKGKRYRGKERKAIAIGLGKLLSYKMNFVREKLKTTGK